MSATRSAVPFRTVHVAALCLCATMLPWSAAVLSLTQALLVLNWIVWTSISREQAQHVRSSIRKAPLLVFLSFFGLHLLGLLWTKDLDWGLDLCRILAPVLVFGLVLGTTPRSSAGELRLILLLGAWGAIASALFGLFFHKTGADDYRGIAMFISHIRLALLLCMAVVVLLYYRQQNIFLIAAHWCGVVLALYLLNRLGSIQGFFILFAIGGSALWRRARKLTGPRKLILRVAIIALPMATAVGTISMIDARHEPFPTGLLERNERTAGGLLYYHDTTNTQTVNGHHIWSYLAIPEMQRTWPLRSSESFDGPDGKGSPIWSTAVRYLASKGMRKDSVSIMSLTDEEVRAIELGTVNAERRPGTLMARVDEVLFEIDQYISSGKANGHSFTMRIEFQKAGLAIARENWTTGVGTGDTQMAFDAYYSTHPTGLEQRWWLRAHNEYLTLAISFGVFGLLWSLFAWCWPAHAHKAWKQPLFLSWAITFGISCLVEDTIETQAGATFFALYYNLLVFAAPKDDAAVQAREERVSA